ncbi:Hypothetical_protein [Hexamita inflata]|uniref:Hypothetical_protein n=1 Tax=Hexamita inflata TaxID=28002 RepID=A0AA86PS96_9EUKA|nr:Hypothetical protein HINF_LOCUS32884 [Hexamita inflata]
MTQEFPIFKNLNTDLARELITNSPNIQINAQNILQLQAILQILTGRKYDDGTDSLTFIQLQLNQTQQGFTIYDQDENQLNEWLQVENEIFPLNKLFFVAQHQQNIQLYSPNVTNAIILCYCNNEQNDIEKNAIQIYFDNIICDENSVNIDSKQINDFKYQAQLIKMIRNKLLHINTCDIQKTTKLLLMNIIFYDCYDIKHLKINCQDNKIKYLEEIIKIKQNNIFIYANSIQNLKDIQQLMLDTVDFMQIQHHTYKQYDMGYLVAINEQSDGDSQKLLIMMEIPNFDTYFAYSGIAKVIINLVSKQQRATLQAIDEQSQCNIKLIAVGDVSVLLK